MEDKLVRVLEEIKSGIQTKKVSPRVLYMFKKTYLEFYPEDTLLEYEELAFKLNTAFNIHCTGRDLWALEEPTLDQEVLDLELQYKNMGL